MSQADQSIGQRLRMTLRLGGWGKNYLEMFAFTYFS